MFFGKCIVVFWEGIQKKCFAFKKGERIAMKRYAHVGAVILAMAITVSTMPISYAADMRANEMESYNENDYEEVVVFSAYGWYRGN